MRRMQTRAERQCYQGLNEPGKSSESVLYAFCFLSSCSDAGYRKQVAVHLGRNGEMMAERQMSVETGATTPAPFPCRIAPQFNQVAGANGGFGSGWQGESGSRRGSADRCLRRAEQSAPLDIGE